jgi:tripartite-type tricarboxylate transporter receptor subunit TctC
MGNKAAIALTCCLFAALAVEAGSEVRAQDYPARPITIVVPFPPGAANDSTARTMQNHLKELLGQPIVIENRPGAAGNIGAASVAKSPADGYTLLLVTNTVFTVNPQLLTSSPFDPERDFVQVSKLARTPMLLVVNPSLPVKTVPEFIEYARKNPGQVSYATAGVGSGHHIAGEQLKQAAGIDIVAVPYKGGGPAMTDLIGGHIKAAMAVLPAVLPYIGTDKVRILAVLDQQRYPGLPDVPTLSEFLPGVEMPVWLGLAAPAGTPMPVVQKLNDAVAETLKPEAMKELFLKQGMVIETSSPQALANEVRSEQSRWSRVIEKAGIPKE